jgi:hypothetical protein
MDTPWGRSAAPARAPIAAFGIATPVCFAAVRATAVGLADTAAIAPIVQRARDAMTPWLNLL